jgi:hypothetical protein
MPRPLIEAMGMEKFTLYFGQSFCCFWASHLRSRKTQIRILASHLSASLPAAMVYDSLMWKEQDRWNCSVDSRPRFRKQSDLGLED